MVGFNPDRVEKGLTTAQCGICGSVAGAFTRLIAQPLDVLKIRFQLQVEPTFQPTFQITTKVTTGKYTGVWQAGKLVFEEEGFAALWKGHVPAQALSVVYGYFQFTCFEAFTKAAYFISPRTMEKKYKPATHFMCGAFSGCAAAVMAQPLDVIRTRLVAQGEPKIYNSLLQAARVMYKGEGPTVFFKGLTPSLLQIFPYSGLQFGSYSLLKTIWDHVFDIKVTDVIESLTCGALSGMISKAVILPFDIIKKRIQVQGFEEARQSFGRVQQYDGVKDCFRTILKEEGAMGLFKGLAPSTLKAAVTVGIMFCTYEQCLHLFRKLIHKGDRTVSPAAAKHPGH
ncbi:predicted protein [Nematostella vectensis]|uniref:Mitochondrial thiamine pyrophosphate carrier n=1 Tax=Nematostella vectensis TaxID=45351 RepID=A7T3S4_NEMVE|nr:predicted protein [Nematostella vectensis]|eukprot:XP_001621491.1 hypothetical protein NEMVEDRAFT_v1g195684 [Nematostella vectensis]